jgi:predicted transcriptional regulator
MSNTLTIRLPEELSRWLDDESKATGLPKGRIIKEHLENLRTARARQPFLDLAGRVDGEPELSSKKGFAK